MAQLQSVTWKASEDPPWLHRGQENQLSWGGPRNQHFKAQNCRQSPCSPPARVCAGRDCDPPLGMAPPRPPGGGHWPQEDRPCRTQTQHGLTATQRVQHTQQEQYIHYETLSKRKHGQWLSLGRLTPITHCSFPQRSP